MSCTRVASNGYSAVSCVCTCVCYVSVCVCVCVYVRIFNLNHSSSLFFFSFFFVNEYIHYRLWKTMHNFFFFLFPCLQSVSLQSYCNRIILYVYLLCISMYALYQYPVLFSALLYLLPLYSFSFTYRASH